MFSRRLARTASRIGRMPVLAASAGTSIPRRARDGRGDHGIRIVFSEPSGTQASASGDCSLGDSWSPSDGPASSTRMNPALADVDIREELSLVDLGDVSVVASQIEASFPAMEAAVAVVAQAGGLPVCVGGDGTISLAVLRGLSPSYPDLAFVHIDAHTDSYDQAGINAGTTFTRAAEERLVETRRSFHIGARGTLAVGGAYDQTRALGYRLITGEQVSERGPAAIAAELREVIGGRPVHLSFDMDYFDPSAAPGVAELGRTAGSGGVRPPPRAARSPLLFGGHQHAQPAARCRRHDGNACRPCRRDRPSSHPPRP